MEPLNAEEELDTQTNGTSFPTTCFNGLNALTGIGILSIPYALSQGGWLSLASLFVVAAVCFYTALLIKKCMDSSSQIHTYPDIGAHAFGMKGRVLISTVMYANLFLVAVECLILEGDNLHKLFPHTHIRVWGKTIGGKPMFIVLSALVMLPTTLLRDLSLLAYVSAGGIVASIVILGTVVWIGAFERVGFHGNGALWKYSGMPTTVSLFTFCYCGHVVFPTIYNSMRDRTKFPKVMLVCFLFSTMIHGSMAVVGYLMYGDNLLSQVTLNLPLHNTSTKIAIYTMLINPISKYALYISPIATTLEIKFARNNDGLRYLIRSSLVVCTAIIALSVPFFGYIMAFIGAFFGVFVCIVFPSLCYLKIHPASRKLGAELIVIVVIIVIGIFVAVTGTFVAVRDIVAHV